MNRFLALFAFATLALAEERPLPNPEILAWQAEAQARERAINRRVGSQLGKARSAQAGTQASESNPRPKALDLDLSLNRPAGPPTHARSLRVNQAFVPMD